jgi:hypothetical protein
MLQLWREERMMEASRQDTLGEGSKCGEGIKTRVCLEALLDFVLEIWIVIIPE